MTISVQNKGTVVNFPYPPIKTITIWDSNRAGETILLNVVDDYTGKFTRQVRLEFIAFPTWKKLGFWHHPIWFLFCIALGQWGAILYSIIFS